MRILEGSSAKDKKHYFLLTDILKMMLELLCFAVQNIIMMNHVSHLWRTVIINMKGTMFICFDFKLNQILLYHNSLFCAFCVFD